MRASTARVCLHSLDDARQRQRKGDKDRGRDREREREMAVQSADRTFHFSWHCARHLPVRVRQRRLGDKLSGLDLVARYLSTSFLFPRQTRSLRSNRINAFHFRDSTLAISVVAISTRIPRTRAPVIFVRFSFGI